MPCVPGKGDGEKINHKWRARWEHDRRIWVRIPKVTLSTILVNFQGWDLMRLMPNFQNGQDRHAPTPSYTFFFFFLGNNVLGQYINFESRLSAKRWRWNQSGCAVERRMTKPNRKHCSWVQVTRLALFFLFRILESPEWHFFVQCVVSRSTFSYSRLCRS